MDKNMTRTIFVDFDGTLAKQDIDRYKRQIGEPIFSMIDKVKTELDKGSRVVIFTARASYWADDHEKSDIEQFCLKHIGQILPITAIKEHYIDEIWDDRAREIIKNQGEFKHAT